MQIVKLFVSDSVQSKGEQERISAYVQKLNSIFKYRDFIISWSLSDRECESGLHVDKSKWEICCSYTNTDVLGLDVIIGLGLIMDYNIQDYTDIKDSKLSIDNEDLINFANVPFFAQHPCIEELRTMIAEIPADSDDGVLLKKRSEHVQNLRRYDFMVYHGRCRQDGLQK